MQEATMHQNLKIQEMQNRLSKAIVTLQALRMDTTRPLESQQRLEEKTKAVIHALEIWIDLRFDLHYGELTMPIMDAFVERLTEAKKIAAHQGGKQGYGLVIGYAQER